MPARKPPADADAPEIAQATDAFQTEAANILRQLRRATADVLAACQGVERAVEVSNRLGLDRSLAWKIWNVGQGSGGCPSPAHIPGRAGFHRFLEAAAAIGVNSDAIREANGAYAAFERLTQIHAGDRASATSMLGALSPEGRTRLETALRRDGFRANAYFLGVQAAVMYQADFLLPPLDGFMPDVARIRGHFGLRRNRPNLHWQISRTTLLHSDGPSSLVTRRPLLGGSGTDDLTALFVLPAFSSQPLPPIHRRVVGGVTFEDELAPGAVGQLAAVDVVTGERMSDMPRQEHRRDAVTMAVTTPCERLVYDIFLAEGLIDSPVTLHVYSTIQSEHPYLRGVDFHGIPIPEQLDDMGRADSAPVAAEVPRQSEMIRWVCSQIGVPLSQFQLWRLRMRFPPIPIRVAADYLLT